MLKELIDEWNNAVANAVPIEDKINDDGETFDYRRVAVNFRGTKVEILSKRRPGSGLVADGKTDPAKGPKYLVTIFVPSTGKCIENEPADSIVPQSSKMIAILQALDAFDHEALVAERKKEQSVSIEKIKAEQWMKTLEDTAFTDDEKVLFIEYAKGVLERPIVRKRGDVFINVMSKWSKQIIGKDNEYVYSSGKSSHTLADVIYNIICQCLEAKMKNDHDDWFVPLAVIGNRFWNTETEMNMKEDIKAARSVLREIYSFCFEKTAAFTYVIIGIAKYYEAVTGESVSLRIARNAQRRKEAKDRAAARNYQLPVGSKKDRQGRKMESQVDGENFGSLSSYFDNVKI